MIELTLLLLLTSAVLPLAFCHGNYPYDVYIQLQRESDVVVEGSVVQVFSTRERRRDGEAEKLLKQFNVIQIFVDKIHKSDRDGDATVGQALYAHTWNVAFAPTDCSESDRGQRMSARVGDSVQLFLTRDAADGSLHAINPNGLEILAKL